MTANAVTLSHRAVFILSFVIAAICYLNALPNEYVFDDGPIVASNPAIRSITPIKFLKSPYWAQQQYEGIYRPFTIFSLSIDYAVWHKHAAGFRLMNLVLHAVNGFLVFLLCGAIVGEGIAPLAAMLIYVAHPVHAEAVTTIVSSELLSALFLLSAWLLFRRGQTVLPAVLFLFALLSKENAIVLPGVLLLDWFVVKEERTAAFLKRFAPMTLVALGYLALRYSVLGAFGIPASAQYMGGQLTYAERIMTSGRVFIEYLRLIFFPVNLPGDYDFNAIPIADMRNWDAWLGLLLIFVIALGAFFLRRRAPVVSLGVLFAFLVIVPASNWIFPISVLMAERFLYLPLVGLAIAAGVAFSTLRNHRLERLVGAGVLLVAIVFCNSHDYIRRNDFSFFENMVRIQPNSAKARLGYGYALLQAGRKDDAVVQLEAGLRIIPDFPEFLTTLAMTKMTQTSCDQAWPLLMRSLDVNPNHANTQRRIGDCLFKEGRIEEAEAMYRKALSGIPFPDSLLYVMWARTLEGTGQRQSAITAYERAALIDPQNVIVQEKLTALRAQ